MASLKFCPKCRVAKPVGDFPKNRACPDGLNRWCRNCQNEARRLYLLRPETKAQRRQYRQRPEVKERHRQYQRTSEVKGRREERRQRLRHRQIKRYGGYCLLCGDSDIRHLVIDHVEGRGQRHRQQLGGNDAFYRWLVRQPLDRSRFRVLCDYCNNLKRPHIPDFKIRLKVGRIILDYLDRQRDLTKSLSKC